MGSYTIPQWGEYPIPCICRREIANASPTTSPPKTCICIFRGWISNRSWGKSFLLVKVPKSSPLTAPQQRGIVVDSSHTSDPPSNIKHAELTVVNTIHDNGPSERDINPQLHPEYSAEDALPEASASVPPVDLQPKHATLIATLNPGLHPNQSTTTDVCGVIVSKTCYISAHLLIYRGQRTNRPMSMRRSIQAMLSKTIGYQLWKL